MNNHHGNEGMHSSSMLGPLTRSGAAGRPLTREASIDAFVAAPVGAWVLAGTAIVWCWSPRLMGFCCLAPSGLSSTPSLLQALEAYRHPDIAARFNFMFDCRRVIHIETDGIGLVHQWIGARGNEIARRATLVIGVVPPGIVGMALAGILPAAGVGGSLRVVKTPIEGYRAVAGADSETVYEQLRSLEEAAAPHQVSRLRTLIGSKYGDVSLEAAARLLGLSRRSLQRVLREDGTSFQEEVDKARFGRAAERLLAREKVERVAADLGVSSDALARLFRKRAGCTPAEYYARAMSEHMARTAD